MPLLPAWASIPSPAGSLGLPQLSSNAAPVGNIEPSQARSPKSSSTPRRSKHSKPSNKLGWACKQIKDMGRATWIIKSSRSLPPPSHWKQGHPMAILSQKEGGRKQDLRKSVKPPLEIYFVSQTPKVRRQQLCLPHSRIRRQLKQRTGHLQISSCLTPHLPLPEKVPC